MNLTSKQSEIVRFIWKYRKTRGISPTLSEIAEQLGVSKITVHEHISLLEKKGALKKDKYQSRSLKLSRAVVRELEAVDQERDRLGLPPVVPGAVVSGSNADDADDDAHDDVAHDDVVDGDADDEAPLAEPARVAAAALEAEAPARRRSARPQAEALALSIPLRGRIAAGRPIEAVEDSEELDIATVLRLDRASYALRVRGDSMIEDGIHDGDYVLVDESRRDPHEGETVVAIVEGNEATLKRFYRDGDHFKLVPANARLQPISVPKDKLEIRGVVVGQLRRY